MRERIFILIFFLLAVSSFASSQESGTKSLKLNEAISLALKNNVSVKRKEITLEASKRASEHSWNSLLPSLSASANNEINLPDLDASDTAGKNEVQNNFGVEGKIALSISADFFASIQKTKLDYEADRISFDETVFEIISQVKETYFSLILSSTCGKTKVCQRRFFTHH